MATPDVPARTTVGFRTFVACALGIALVAGLVGGLIGHLATGLEDPEATPVAAATSTHCNAETVADTVLPAVVTLAVRGSSSAGNGSGQVIRDGGYILTNDHVIAPAVAGGIDVLFAGGQSGPATVIGRAGALDLAVVKVRPPAGLPVITIGRSKTLRVGQPVVALGSPLGLSGTVTSGIISALGRDVPLPAEGGRTAIVPGAIQTDAAINPGNSGGALVDCAGRLVGVNTAIATVPNAVGEAGGGSVGIGFAIPVDLATMVADQLIADGRFTPAYAGISVAPLPSGAADRFGVTGGLYVQAVTPSGPAARAGLRTGDIITQVGGAAVSSPDDLVLRTLTRRVGDPLVVDYVRGGRAGSTTVTLGERP
ncbi:trypsin-like peptidase domain-containing protein [Actinoplanes sp. NPDC048791]|uniref:S1C family serine protease n=1 Tax=Actinoplanes sp. NPDC048791 TaxID=3154623 RepID=UPI00340E9466